MAVTEQARLAQKAKRATAKKPSKTKPEILTLGKPAIIRQVATIGDKSLAIEFAGTPRSEFLTVAAGAVGLVHAELSRKANGVTWQAAVDAILAEADRRWPR